MATMQTFSNRKDLCNELAGVICGLLAAGIKERGHASLAVSGGSTPVALFERLSTLDISWENVYITLVDERWVEPNAVDSNENLVRSHLLKNKAAGATFIGMKTSADTAGEGEDKCQQRLDVIPRPFDVLILGMGSDGHTASLFPGAEKLSLATDMDSRRICMAIAPITAPHERMTLTLPAILDSRQIFVHITGENKKEVLEKAMAKGAESEMPIRFILRQKMAPVSIYWAS